MLISACLAGALLAFLLFLLADNACKRPNNFPPGPPNLPIYGAYWIVLAVEFNNLARALWKIGRYYKTKLVGMRLGPYHAITVNDPLLIKEMLLNEKFDGRADNIIVRLRSFWKRLGIFFTDGYFWHTQRRFSLRHLRDFGFGRRARALEDVVEAELKAMIHMRLDGPKHPAESEIVRGECVCLPHFLDVPFINGMLHILFGATLPRAHYHKIWRMCRGAVRFQTSSDDVGGSLVLTPWVRNIFPNWSGYNGLFAGNQEIVEFVKEFLSEAAATREESRDRHFVDAYLRRMAQERRDAERSTFSMDQLTMVCVDFLFPAASAVQAVLAMLVERLALQPELQQRIHAEIDAVVGRGRLPTLDDRPNMPYTEACIREAMRCDPLVPLGVLHQCTEDTAFAGYSVPRGTVLNANYLALHMDAALWGDPAAFRPDRFLERGRLYVAKDKSLPFGAGRRLCAGETFARQAMFQVVAGLLQAFRVEPLPRSRPTARRQGIITTIPDYWVRLTPRPAH